MNIVVLVPYATLLSWRPTAPLWNIIILYIRACFNAQSCTKWCAVMNCGFCNDELRRNEKLASKSHEKYKEKFEAT